MEVKRQLEQVQVALEGATEDMDLMGRLLDDLDLLQRHSPDVDLDMVDMDLLKHTVVHKYVTPHLHLMISELVKNSLRAVQERYMDYDKLAPPVRIIVADGADDVTIKITDEGGGIPRSGLSRIFTYLYSTTENPPDLDVHNEGVTMAYMVMGFLLVVFMLDISAETCRSSLWKDMELTYLHLSRLGDSEEPLT
ncbi:Putative hydroxymethylglutaryl-CoA synthase family protein [Zea mays]|uniref:Protein-serine/threonine kinase n=1 Tax=Zea mays TaxID=4577 RepID=A0A1D6QLT7_MAIZE|nr:Putative hydroxymethylglutaryl-CoA synthase family protein [Zea mays]